MIKKRLHLNSGWLFSAERNRLTLTSLPEIINSGTNWLPAQVPGTIHTDLLQAGIIENPFFRDNERRVQWVAQHNWVYKNKFILDKDMLAQDAIHLVALGLDTFAMIYINDKQIAVTENMFISHRFDIKKFVRQGENEVRIVFNSPVIRTKALEKEHGTIWASHESHRVYARKAQYSFGWDWGPILATSGIWRPIYIEAFSSVRIKDVHVTSKLNDALNAAKITVSLELEKTGETNEHLEAVFKFNNSERKVPVSGKHQQVIFEVKNPSLWWPAGYGRPFLYDLEITLLKSRETIDGCSKKVGIRKVELLQENDELGRSFFFKINNEPIFCKGANWIPADTFLPRIEKEKYRKLIRAAKDANINMLRVWGGGIYENDVFYETCDEQGILVWQDFMFACGGYPDYDAFQKNVAEEIDAVIRRLRNHASIIIWCGNNEIQWVWQRFSGHELNEMLGLSYFHELIPTLCAKLDPDRPYVPGTPFGGDEANSMNTGTRHQWEIWSEWQDFTRVDNDHGRFITEFGFQAPANAATLEKVVTSQDRRPQSEIMEFHNKQIEGSERLFRFLAAHVQVPVTFDEFIYRAQVVQGEALKYCIEHWRRQKFSTSGVVIWQLNDCWPVSSWALIDSDLLPKASYYYVRKAFSQQMIAMKLDGDNVETCIVNDSLADFQANVQISGLSFLGDELFSRCFQVSIRGNTLLNTDKIAIIYPDHIPLSEYYLKAELVCQGKIVSENRLFFKPIKHLVLRRAAIDMQMQKVDDNIYRLSLLSAHFVKSVCLQTDCDADFSDNYIDLDAGKKKNIEIKVGENMDLGIDNISLHSMINS